MKEIDWEKVDNLFQEICKEVGIDLYDSEDISIFTNGHGIDISWYTFMDHPKYGSTTAYFRRSSVNVYTI